MNFINDAWHTLRMSVALGGTGGGVNLQMDAPSCCSHSQCAGYRAAGEPEKSSSPSASRVSSPAADCRWASHADARWSHH